MADQHTVASDGVHLNVMTSGDPAAPTVVLLHGFPDNHHVWDQVVPLLNSFHVVTYDVRGAGDSTAPSGKAGYTMPHLIDDFVAVLDHACADGRPVHLVGHDWGSIQGWGIVNSEVGDERLRGRIASYTSISGPSLELFTHFLRSSLRHRQFGRFARQIANSWYVGAFQLPRLPEFAFGRRFAPALARQLAKSGRADDANERSYLMRDGSNGVNLYRANGLTSARSSTNLPVQLIVPTRDAFLSPAVYQDIDEFAPNTTRIDVAADHWIPHTHPDLLADRITAFAELNSPSKG